MRMRLGVGTNGQIRGRMDRVAGKGEKMVKKKDKMEWERAMEDRAKIGGRLCRRKPARLIYAAKLMQTDCSAP